MIETGIQVHSPETATNTAEMHCVLRSLLTELLRGCGVLEKTICA